MRLRAISLVAFIFCALTSLGQTSSTDSKELHFNGGIVGGAGPPAAGQSKPAPNQSPGAKQPLSQGYSSNPCKVSDAIQSKDMARGDKRLKYENPCVLPPFMKHDKLQAPGLPAIPVPPPVEQPVPYADPMSFEWNLKREGSFSVSRAGYAAAEAALQSTFA